MVEADALDELGRPTFRVAVVSDLHACVFDPSVVPTPSHLHTRLNPVDPASNPITGLVDLAARENLHADAVLCCGDIGDRADQNALVFGWQQLHTVATVLGGQVVATAGNHDVDSRGLQWPHDPEKALKRLVPLFPVNDQQLANQYWARHFTIVELPFANIVTINSCAYHGREAEYEKGRIDPDTVTEIRQQLDDIGVKPVQLLLCHHHPHRFGDIDLDDYSEMDGGQNLIAALSNGRGYWTIVHGHKHFPHLAYATGGGMSPVVFSAGSLSASLYPQLQTRARNQFYFIEFDLASSRALRLGIAATFRSWNWVSARGWEAGGGDAGLPGRGGFGYRANLVEVADWVEAEIADQSWVDWAAIVAVHPVLKYLAPADVESLRQILAEERGVRVTGGRYEIEQVAR